MVGLNLRAGLSFCTEAPADNWPRLRQCDVRSNSSSGVKMQKMFLNHQQKRSDFHVRPWQHSATSSTFPQQFNWHYYVHCRVRSVNKQIYTGTFYPLNAFVGGTFILFFIAILWPFVIWDIIIIICFALTLAKANVLPNNTYCWAKGTFRQWAVSCICRPGNIRCSVTDPINNLCHTLQVTTIQQLLSLNTDKYQVWCRGNDRQCNTG